MILEHKDARLFYDLWLPLLDFTNIKYQIDPRLGQMHGAKNLEPRDVKVIADHV